MSPQKQALIEKIRTLPAAKREICSRLDSGCTELSAPSFARIWDNPQDSAYDAL